MVKVDKEILEILKDLLYINAIIATELVRITENTASMAGKPETKVAKCSEEHQKLNEQIIKLVKKYKSTLANILENHVLPH